MKPVLVLGATGKVGRHVVSGLADARVPVRAITRDATRAKETFAAENLSIAGAEFIQADVRDLDAIRVAAEGCGQAYVASSDVPEQVEMEVNAVKAALEAGVGPIVKLSSCDAAPDAPFSWARQHDEIEREISSLTTEFSHLRPHYFMQNLFTEVIDNVIYLPAGDGRLGIIDARDIAATAVKLLVDETPLRRTAELTGPEPVSFSRIASAITAATNTEVVYEPCTEQEFLDRMTARGQSSSEIARVYRDVSDGVLDMHTDEVEKITGRAPRTIEQFALDYAERFSSR